uniref:Interleukin 17 receptor A n=1 Tax=Anolis carolinensis TaxID=28377 RepID=G1KY25_ANOCA
MLCSNYCIYDFSTKISQCMDYKNALDNPERWISECWISETLLCIYIYIYMRLKDYGNGKRQRITSKQKRKRWEQGACKSEPGSAHAHLASTVSLSQRSALAPVPLKTIRTLKWREPPFTRSGRGPAHFSASPAPSRASFLQDNHFNSQVAQLSRRREATQAPPTSRKPRPLGVVPGLVPQSCPAPPPSSSLARASSGKLPDFPPRVSFRVWSRKLAALAVGGARRMGVAALLPPVLLLGLGAPLVPGLRLLSDARHFNCSQPGLLCLVRNSTCMDQSWLRSWEWTPSAPSSINVHVGTYFDAERKLVPVLKTEWKVATDASIRFLRGVELTVLQVSSNQQVCVQFDFQNDLLSQVSPSSGRPWNFSFNQFEVQPGQAYHVTVQHLPILSTRGDHNWKSMPFTVPDCLDPLMKTTVPCVKIGSLWEPNIFVESQDVDSLLVIFNPAVESTSYIIHVTSFQDEKECKKATKQISEEGLQQRLNVTVVLERNLKSCCEYQVQIQPFFAACATDCRRHLVSIPCPTLSPVNEIEDPDYLSVGLPLALTAICILLVGSAVASTICLARRHKDLLSTSPTPPPLKPRKVWIVYSADHKLYVDVVMKFAQFMITVCGTEVILDLLNERQISEMGPLRWLTRQKQEMEALSSKIIILCSRGTRAKWQAMLGRDEISVSLRQDNLLPVGDMFTPALNLILPDFKQPSCFGMYLVCYFEGISNERDIPDPFNVTSKYQLMDKFEEVYFLIQNLEKFEPGRIHQIPEISPEKYMENPSGRQLKEALQTFQKWQAEHPDWFKKENTLSASEDDLQSLNGELSEELTPLQGGIVKHQLILQEPIHNSCLVNLLVTENDLGAHRLLPKIHSEDDVAFQTLVLPADDSSQVQMLMPYDLAEEGGILSHHLLTNEDSLERMPITDVNLLRRNSAIFQDDVSSSPQPLSADVRQQLSGLMYSLYQQSITPCEPSLCQNNTNEQHGLVFDSSKDQRQSVQSDQGYISRCSPLPSDSPVEEEEEEEGGQEKEGHRYNGSLSQDVLDNLKSLQQQLFFQDIQHSFS